METSSPSRGPSEILEFGRHEFSYSTPPASYHVAEHHRHDLDEHDFDTFVEQQLRDGSGSLFADATTWMERRLLVRVLAQTNGNKSKACQILGITRGSLRHKICHLGIAIHQTVSLQETNGR